MQYSIISEDIFTVYFIIHVYKQDDLIVCTIAMNRLDAEIIVLCEIKVRTLLIYVYCQGR